MRVRIRLLLIVGAAILVFAGTVAGWLIALSRGRTVSDAIVSAILTGLFTLLGEGIGLLVPMIQEWERTRPNLKLQLSYRCLHASPAIRTPSLELRPLESMTIWIRSMPENPTAALFLLLDLQVQNRSHLDDAITDIQIEVPVGSRTAHLPVRLPDGSDFFGESIPAHQLRTLRLCLMLDRNNYANTPNWIPSPAVVWRLVARTINDQTITEEVRPVAHFPAFEESAIEELDLWPE